MTILLSGVVVATDGQLLDLSSLPHALTYLNGNIMTDTVTVDGSQYRQTYTYNVDNTISTVSAWVFFA